MGLLNNIFTWWNGPGLGTRIMTRRHGQEVGRDGEGNIYYRSGAGATERRWVIYNGTPEATRIPPDWHLWMHKTVARPPTEAPLTPRVWEQPWTPNATGTARAYLPAGSLDAGGKRAATTGDYRAWSPDGDNRKSSPDGDNRKSSPDGDSRKSSPEGDSRKSSPDGDSKMPSPTGDI